jgi:dsDNA-specific endonuclease/ATPase MutS2
MERLQDEEVDITAVLEGIIELDKKASRIKKNVEKRSVGIKTKAKKDLKAKYEDSINNAKEDANKRYEYAIDLAKKKSVKIINESNHDIQLMQQKYALKKDHKTDEVLEYIIQSNQ